MGLSIRVACALMLLLSNACASIDPSNRPLELAGSLADSPLKHRLLSCQNGPFERTRFSIAHRGAPLGYPEHTREGYIAAASMGAGFIECDVTFTKDLVLVCRHSQCDLHRTTNILQTELAGQCTTGFRGATTTEPAQARCCTSDITSAQFKSLCGRHDRVNAQATSIDEYLAVPPPRLARTDSRTCGALVTHDESIALFKALGVAMIPELKAAQVEMPFKGVTRSDFASRMVRAYERAGIDPGQVWPQSFSMDVLRHWLEVHPEFARGALFLDPRGRDPNFVPSLSNMRELKEAGINVVAPPMPMLLNLDASGELQASDYARYARRAGLEIVTWTFEAGDASDPRNWMYANLAGFMSHEGKMLEVLHALRAKVGIKAIFSDWSGTVTYYANCYDL